MGILAQSDHNCNATLNKVPDYAKDYNILYILSEVLISFLSILLII